mmetsp:Transcript_75758/g.214156  ORF Transcript_75758/g.214156 Transcript_75758/m.214156 type:complete len:207 (-) Transcript_75758:1637-2257(-)
MTHSNSSAWSSIHARTSSGRARAETRRQSLLFEVQTDMTPALDMETRSLTGLAAASGASSGSEAGAENTELASAAASARCETQLGKYIGEVLASVRSAEMLPAMDSRTVTSGSEMRSGTPWAYSFCKSLMHLFRCSSPQQPRTFSPVTIACTRTDGSALCSRRRPRSRASRSAMFWGSMLTRTIAKAWVLYGVSRQGPSAASQSVR